MILQASAGGRQANISQALQKQIRKGPCVYPSVDKECYVLLKRIATDASRVHTNGGGDIPFQRPRVQRCYSYLRGCEVIVSNQQNRKNSQKHCDVGKELASAARISRDANDFPR